MNLPKTSELYDTSHTLAKELLDGTTYPHEALPKIKDYIIELQKKLSPDEYDEISEGVFAAKDAKIDPKATILPPTIIGHNTEVRCGAFIRGSALIGDGAVIGNSTEIKNAIVFDSVQLPHYNYVGDSIMGYKSHLGAGAIASNFKLDHSNINVRMGDEVFATGLRKFGVMLGDFSEIGCNSVLYPGTVIGKNTLVYPVSSVRGVIEANSIYHNQITPVIKPRKD
ncbi:MAG: UDP-N-acetylglucosamine pyrophosphorylase [Clostridia bacterium]|nr:UDP-N-acetylglucosamine pyrophosphorylase [Clostridia bacterium]